MATGPDFFPPIKTTVKHFWGKNDHLMSPPNVTVSDVGTM